MPSLKPPLHDYLSAPYNLYNAIVINKILLLFHRDIKGKKEKET